MNGIDVLVTVGGISLIALACWIMQWERRVDESRRRHEAQVRHWRITDRINQYSYRQELLSVDALIEDVLGRAA